MIDFEKIAISKRLPLGAVSESLNTEEKEILLWLLENDKNFHYVSEDGETKLCRYEDDDWVAINELVQQGRAHVLWGEDADHDDGGHVTGIFEEIKIEDLMITADDAIEFQTSDLKGGQSVSSLLPGKILTGRKEIMEGLGVSSWTTVKKYKKKGLLITCNRANNKPQTTDAEIERWRLS